MESVIIHVIVASAVLYLARWFYKNVVVKTDTNEGCSSCESCESEKTEKPVAPGAHSAVTK